MDQRTCVYMCGIERASQSIVRIVEIGHKHEHWEEDNGEGIKIGSRSEGQYY